MCSGHRTFCDSREWVLRFPEATLLGPVLVVAAFRDFLAAMCTTSVGRPDSGETGSAAPHHCRVVLRCTAGYRNSRLPQRTAQLGRPRESQIKNRAVLYGLAATSRSQPTALAPCDCVRGSRDETPGDSSPAQ